MSESLGGRFRTTAWTGVQLGTFTVLFRARAVDGYVTALVLDLGDTPPDG